MPLGRYLILIYFLTRSIAIGKNNSSSEPRKNNNEIFNGRFKSFLARSGEWMTIENIKETCKTIFCEHGLSVYILASEMGRSCTKFYISKFFIFDFLVSNFFWIICRQSWVDMSVNIFNPNSIQIYPKYSHPHSALYAAVSQKWVGVKSNFLKFCLFCTWQNLKSFQIKRDRHRVSQSRVLMSARKNESNYVKFYLNLPNSILEKVGLEGHSKLQVTTFYFKMRVGY